MFGQVAPALDLSACTLAEWLSKPEQALGDMAPPLIDWIPTSA
jgi:hypothetical protein